MSLSTSLSSSAIMTVSEQLSSELLRTFMNAAGAAVALKASLQAARVTPAAIAIAASSVPSRYPARQVCAVAVHVLLWASGIDEACELTPFEADLKDLKWQSALRMCSRIAASLLKPCAKHGWRPSACLRGYALSIEAGWTADDSERLTTQSAVDDICRVSTRRSLRGESALMR